MTWEGIKPGTSKVQCIIDLGRPTTITKECVLVGVFHYYKYMQTRSLNVIDPMTELSSGPKVRKILLNGNLDVGFKYSKCMVSADTLVNYPDRKFH